MPRFGESQAMTPEHASSQLKLPLSQQQYSAIRHVLKSNKANAQWMRVFVAQGGFLNLLKNISLVCQPENRPNNAALSALVACVSVVMATKQGLDAAASSSTVLNSLVLGLISEEELVKRDILTLLSTLTLHSATTCRLVLEAFHHFKSSEHVSYRFVVLVDDLRNTDSVEYQKSLLNFFNCIIDRCSIPDKRIDLRNEIIALGLLEVLKTLRSTQNSSVAQQIIHFYEQKAKDELKLPPTIDVTNPPAMFNLLWRKIAKTPRSNDLMKIVQKLLFTVDTSDLWGAAIDALSGPRSTQGVFKEERLNTEITPEDKERFPESPGAYVAPQTLDWRAVKSESVLEQSVWARVQQRKNTANVRNIGAFFYQSHPPKTRLLYISVEKTVSLNLLLATVDHNRHTAVDLLTNAIIDGDATLIPDTTLKRLWNLLPRDPALLASLSEYDGELDALDTSELLLVAISRIPEFQTRFKCILGVTDIPAVLADLERSEETHSNVLASLTSPDCPFFDLLKLVLEIGNTVNEGPAVHGFKLGALRQLRSMRAPRQPSLTLLRFITQSLHRNTPKTLAYIAELAEDLLEIGKKTLEQFDTELRDIDVRLREIRSLLVIASKDIKLQFTATIVDSGKRVTALRNRRKGLDNKIQHFADFYCEPVADFSLSAYLGNLGEFCSDVVECGQMIQLTNLTSADNRANYSPEARMNEVSDCSSTTSSEVLFSPRLPPRTHHTVTSAYSAETGRISEEECRGEVESVDNRQATVGEVDTGHYEPEATGEIESEGYRRETGDTDISVFSSRHGSDVSYASRKDTYESDLSRMGSTKSEPVGVSLESRLVSPPPKPARPVGMVFDSNREFGRGDLNRSDSIRSHGTRRTGDLKKLHNNYRSVDLTFNRSHSQGYFDRYNSMEYRSGKHQTRSVDEKRRFRHSPPTREQDDQIAETSSEESGAEDTNEDSFSKKLRKSNQQRRLQPDNALRVRSHESRSVGSDRSHESATVGHAAGVGINPPVSFLNSQFGGSCRSFQGRGYQRTDVRDIFANHDRKIASVSDRFGSTSSINKQLYVPRSQRENPQQSSIQAMLRGDQNSKSVIRGDQNSKKRDQPPPIPKREVSGMGRKDHSRSTPALNSPYSRSHCSLSPGSLSPPPTSPSLSPPVSPPLTLSPPLSPPLTLSPPTRVQRPFSAGARARELPIAEAAEFHHERQSSEPTDMRMSEGNARLGRRNISASSSEISTAGHETAV